MRKILAGLAMAGLMMIATPTLKAYAEAAVPGAVQGIAGSTSDNILTDVSARRGGFRGGGRHFGGRHFRGGGRHFRHFGGFRRHYGFRRARFYARPRFYAPRQCHRVWTYYGPRRVCRFTRWY